MPSRRSGQLVASLLWISLGCNGGSRQLGLLGADCLSSGDAACSSGQCLALDSSTAYCTQSCLASVDCPPGFLCAAAGTNQGKICQAGGAGGVCGLDDDCPAGLKCDSSLSRCYIPVTRSSCGPCTSDLQCGAGGSCHAEVGEHFCASACGTGGACAPGYACGAAEGGQRCLPRNGSCRGGRPLCAPCKGDLECGKPGDLCVRNLQSQATFCALRCATALDCAKGFSCIDLSGKGSGPNQCVPDSGTCAGYCDATDAVNTQRECGLGASCDLPNHLCKRATNGSLCADCKTDDDCTGTTPTARCVVNRTAGSPHLGEQFCGSDCSSNCTGTSGAGCIADATKCTAQFSCSGIGRSDTWPFQCVPLRGSCESGFGKLGDSCEKSGASDCGSAICAQFGTEHRCTQSCVADGDCGDARFRCCAGVGSSKYDCTRGPTAGAAGVCAPTGGSFGDDCAPGSPPCQEGLCLDLGTAQLCTRACDKSQTCSASFSCQSATLRQSDGTLASVVNVCFPDGGGGVGSSCAFGPAACKTHLCLKKESGNVCTQPCKINSDCPAQWNCAEESMPDGSRVTVCLPPGVTP